MAKYTEKGEKMVKKGYFCLLMALTLCVTGCDGTVEPDLSAYTAGNAEIPKEIWGKMDEETRQALVEEPKYVALTFDDGPRADTTSMLLNGLLERGAAATFFVIGEQVTGNETLLLRMAVEGHQIGNHTYSHVRLLTAEKNTVIEEVQKTEVILKNLLGERDFWLRPPYGLIDSQRAALIKTPMIYWSLDPEDWKLLDAAKIVDYVVGNVEPGDIILMHDFYPTSVDAALEIIDRLQAQGYTFVTVEELFRIQGVTPQTGVLYASPLQIRPVS